MPISRDAIRILELLYWPVVDMVLFGFLGLWAQGKMVSSENFILAVLVCSMCWYLIYRTSLEINKNLLIEIWEFHLVNLFASPLSIVEFIISLMVLGIFSSLTTFIYSSFIVWLIFDQNVFAWLPDLAPFIPIFIFSGWTIGLLVASLIFYFGKSVDSFIWAIPWLFAMLSGAFYPITLFPQWLQKLVYFIPFSHFFTNVRNLILTNKIDWPDVIVGLVLLLIYFAIAIVLFKKAFHNSKENGLSNLG